MQFRNQRFAWYAWSAFWTGCLLWFVGTVIVHTAGAVESEDDAEGRFIAFRALGLAGSFCFLAAWCLSFHGLLPLKHLKGMRITKVVESFFGILASVLFLVAFCLLLSVDYTDPLSFETLITASRMFVWSSGFWLGTTIRMAITLAFEGNFGKNSASVAMGFKLVAAAFLLAADCTAYDGYDEDTWCSLMYVFLVLWSIAGAAFLGLLNGPLGLEHLQLGIQETADECEGKEPTAPANLCHDFKPIMVTANPCRDLNPPPQLIRIA